MASPRAWTAISIAAAVPLMLVSAFMSFESWDDTTRRGIGNLPESVANTVPLVATIFFVIVERAAIRRPQLRTLVALAVMRVVVLAFWGVVLVFNWVIIVGQPGWGAFWVPLLVVGSLTFPPGYVYDTWKRFGSLVNSS